MIGQHKHLVSLADYSQKDIEKILDQASKFKQGLKEENLLLKQKRIALIFFKASTRTRVSFEAAIHDLGGWSTYLATDAIQIGRGESLEDTIKVLERYVHAVVIRNNSQEDLEAIASFTKIPIINGLTDRTHPCQALADLLTIKEKKKLSDQLKIVYLGDRNNVAMSLAQICHNMGLGLTLISPKNFPSSCDQPPPALLQNQRIRFLELSRLEEILAEVDQSDVIYTDTWTSMGQEKDVQREKIFSLFQINEKLVSVARKDYLFLHCLPAYRGKEVTSPIIDGPNSVIFDQAENRLHVQKAILYLLLK